MDQVEQLHYLACMMKCKLKLIFYNFIALDGQQPSHTPVMQHLAEMV